MGSSDCLFKIIADVFPPGIVLTHPNASDQPNGKISALSSAFN